MTVTTRTVTGPLVHPDAEVAYPARVAFSLSGRDREGTSLVVPSVVLVQVNNDGDFEVDLWVNAEGDAGTSYTARIESGAAGRPRVPYPEFRVVVPAGEGSVALATIMTLVPPDSVDDAQAAADAAQAALAEMQQLVYGTGVQALYVSPTPPTVAEGAPYLWVEDFGDDTESTLWFEEGEIGYTPGRPLYVGEEPPDLPSGIPFLFVETQDASDDLTLFLEDGNA